MLYLICRFINQLTHVYFLFDCVQKMYFIIFGIIVINCTFHCTCILFKGENSSELLTVFRIYDIIFLSATVGIFRVVSAMLGNQSSGNSVFSVELEDLRTNTLKWNQTSQILLKYQGPNVCFCRSFYCFTFYTIYFVSFYFVAIVIFFIHVHKYFYTLIQQQFIFSFTKQHFSISKSLCKLQLSVSTRQLLRTTNCSPYIALILLKVNI